VRNSQIRFIQQQGFTGTDFPESLYSALMFQPRVVGVAAVAGGLLQSPWLFVTLGAALLWSASVPSLSLFDAIYNHAVAYRRGWSPLDPAPAPRRFAQGLAGTVALVIGLAFLIGATAVGWGLEVLLLVGSVAAVARDACAGANLYHLLRRLMASRVTSTHLPPSTTLGRHS
jgi:uncharacterized protein DUF4395